MWTCSDTTIATGTATSDNKATWSVNARIKNQDSAGDDQRCQRNRMGRIAEEGLVTRTAFSRCSNERLAFRLIAVVQLENGSPLMPRVAATGQERTGDVSPKISV